MTEHTLWVRKIDHSHMYVYHCVTRSCSSFSLILTSGSRSDTRINVRTIFQYSNLNVKSICHNFVEFSMWNFVYNHIHNILNRSNIASKFKNYIEIIKDYSDSQIGWGLFWNKDTFCQANYVILIYLESSIVAMGFYQFFVHISYSLLCRTNIWQIYIYIF